MGDFKVGGNWQAIQGNGFVADFAIDREQDNGFSILEAQASHSGGSVTGEGQGKVQGRDFHLRIGWDNGTAGVYNGTFGLDGSLTGVTFDELHPDNVTSWHSSRQFHTG